MFDLWDWDETVMFKRCVLSEALGIQCGEFLFKV